MATIRKLVTGALRLINVVSTNEEPTAADVDVALKSLNALVDSLSNDLLSIYTFTPYRFLFVPGQATYKLGPSTDDAGNATSADWVTERPMRIEQAKVILYPNVDGADITLNQSSLVLPLRSLSASEYAGIRLRNLQNQWSTCVYDDGAYPCRNLSFFPVPSQQQAVELWLWDPLMVYDTLDDELNLPPGYERYLRFKLAVEVAPEFGKELPASLLSSMVEAEANVRRINQQVPVGGASTLGSSISQNNSAQVYTSVYPIGSLPRTW